MNILPYTNLVCDEKMLRLPNSQVRRALREKLVSVWDHQSGSSTRSKTPLFSGEKSPQMFTVSSNEKRSKFKKQKMCTIDRVICYILGMYYGWILSDWSKSENLDQSGIWTFDLSITSPTLCRLIDHVTAVAVREWEWRVDTCGHLLTDLPTQVKIPTYWKW